MAAADGASAVLYWMGAREAPPPSEESKCRLRGRGRRRMRSRLLSAAAGASIGYCAIRLVYHGVTDEAEPSADARSATSQSAHRRAPQSGEHHRRPGTRWPEHRDVLGAAYEWATLNAPFFECSDPDISLAYYYRLRVFWLHLRHTRDGYVLTEFLHSVPWAGPHGTINAAYGHHAADAMWMRNEAIMDNYSLFWFVHPRADRRYSWWPAHAALRRYRLDGRRSMLRALFPHLRAEYSRWVHRSSTTVPGAGTECMWQACHDDGEENSIGLDGCRPSINAMMHGEASALATIAALLGDAHAATSFKAHAERWRRATHALYSERLGFFVTRTMPPPPGRLEDIRRRRTKVGCLYCPGRRRGAAACPPEWPTGQLVTVRELAGLSWPWYHQAAAPEHASAWKQIRMSDGFHSAWGLRTAERRHPCYNFSTWCPTSWHAPVWPFESSKLLTGLATALHDEQLQVALRERAAVGPSDFFDLLKSYAHMHTRGRARGVPEGESFVGESFHPDDGYWLTRELLYQRRQGDRNRGDHYLHSSFADIVLGGLVGLHVILDAPAPFPGDGAPSQATLIVEPLFVPGEQLSSFAAGGLRIRGQEVEVAFDVDGTRYGGSAGLAVWLDGRLAAHSPKLSRLAVRLIQ